MSGEKLLNALVESVRRGNIAKGKEIIDCLRIRFKRTGHKLAKRKQLRGKTNAFAGNTIEERLDTQAGAGQKQAPLARIPQSEGEHTPQCFEAAHSTIFVKMQDYFSVWRRAELMSFADQL